LPKFYRTVVENAEEFKVLRPSDELL